MTRFFDSHLPLGDIRENICIPHSDKTCEKNTNCAISRTRRNNKKFHHLGEFSPTCQYKIKLFTKTAYKNVVTGHQNHIPKDLSLATLCSDLACSYNLWCFLD